MRRAVRAAAALLAALLVLAAAWTLDLPDPSPLKTRPPATTAYIELRRRQAAARGRRLAVRRTWVPYDRISPNLRDAVVTAEDDSFWRNDGVDPDALRAAWRRDWAARRAAAGGSTIAMQLARNLYLSPSKNPLRKLKEMLIARRLVRVLGRPRVLELYLNSVEWGPGIFGCEAAARAYFDKACADLTPDEAAAMAAVLPNPRRWDPAKRGPYVTRNAARIAGRMRAAGLWPAEDAPGPEVSTGTVSVSTAPVSAPPDAAR
jgi:monofunctional biosynthetic peptidoglycan transglycosylase